MFLVNYTENLVDNVYHLKIMTWSTLQLCHLKIHELTVNYLSCYKMILKHHWGNIFQLFSNFLVNSILCNMWLFNWYFEDYLFFNYCSKEQQFETIYFLRYIWCDYIYSCYIYKFDKLENSLHTHTHTHTHTHIYIYIYIDLSNTFWDSQNKWW